MAVKPEMSMNASVPSTSSQRSSGVALSHSSVSRGTKGTSSPTLADAEPVSKVAMPRFCWKDRGFGRRAPRFRQGSLDESRHGRSLGLERRQLDVTEVFAVGVQRERDVSGSRTDRDRD